MACEHLRATSGQEPVPGTTAADPSPACARPASGRGRRDVSRVPALARAAGACAAAVAAVAGNGAAGGPQLLAGAMSGASPAVTRQADTSAYLLASSRTASVQPAGRPSRASAYEKLKPPQTKVSPGCSHRGSHATSAASRHRRRRK